MAAIKNNQNELFTTVRHAVNLGDLICAMASMKKFHQVTKRKLQVLQTINHPANYYPGAVHPTVDEMGANVTMNRKMFDMIKPLVESQDYIHSMVQYVGQKIDLDFEVIRGKTDVGMPNGMLQTWVMYAYPDLAYDVSKAWIELKGKCPLKIKKQVNKKILINFTERYRSHSAIDYFFLKKYAPELIFSGTEKEHWMFCNQWQLSIPLLEADNFLEVAWAIKESRYFMGNQSSHWNIANAMGTPRILEVCKWAFNCHPNVGPDNYGGFYQTSIEYYFRHLYNRK